MNEINEFTLLSRSDFFSIVGGLIVRAIVSVGFVPGECVVNGRDNDVSFDDDDGTISLAYFRSCVAKNKNISSSNDRDKFYVRFSINLLGFDIGVSICGFHI